MENNVQENNSTYSLVFEQEVPPFLVRREGRGCEKFTDIEAILGPLKKAVAALHSMDEG